MSSSQIIVYRDQLLPASNTFVQKQSENLKNFKTSFFGSKEENGFSKSGLDVNLIQNRIKLVNHFEEFLFKSLGVIPRYIRNYKENPVLLHAHFGPDGLLALPISKYFNIPLIVTFHGYEVTIDESLLMNLSFRDKLFVKNKLELSAESSCMIAVSKFLQKKMIERGFDSKKIIQHYIGVDINQFKPEGNLVNDKRILFVGRLVEKKGLEYLIKSLKILGKTLKGVELDIIGEGPLKSELISLAKSLKVTCNFLGSKDSNYIKQRLAKSRVFSVPSVIAKNGDAESFGIVFAEAQAMGIPVVSFASGGIPEVVAHNETGFLADERDIDQLAEYLKILLTDKVLATRFAKNGRDNIEQNFNLAYQTRKLEEIYYDVIKKK